MGEWKRASGKEITYQVFTKVMVSLHKVTIKGMSDKHEPDGRDGSESFSIHSGVNKKSLSFALPTLVAIIRTGQEMGLNISGLM